MKIQIPHINNTQQQNWSRIEDEDSITIIPEWDIKAHANISVEDMKRVENGEKVEFDVDVLTCPCKPTFQMSDDYKTIITHNSFRDMKLIEDSMKKLST